MAVKFFLDAENGSLAFQKEQDFPDWANSAQADNVHPGGANDWSSDPSTTFATEVTNGRALDVRNIRRAVILLQISGADTYDFTVKAGADSVKSGMKAWYTLDGGVYLSQSGNLYVGVDCLGIDYLAVTIDTVSGANTMNAEIAPIPFES